MSELLKSLTGGAWSLIAGWIFPAGIAVSAFALMVFPSIDHWPIAADIAELDATNRVLIIAGISIAIGIALHAIQSPLYRLIEGYSWPKWMRDWGRSRQLERRANLKMELDKAYRDWERGAEPAWEWTLAAEKLQLYPAEVDQTAPSRLGNAFRAFETYGRDRFRLDSQIWWTELSALAPEAVAKDIDRARAAVDFFITLLYALAALAVSSVLILITTGDLVYTWPFHIAGDWPPLAVGVASALLLRPLYSAAVKTTGWFQSSVRALVHLGRTELAESLGLAMPDTLSDEREMWDAATGFVYYAYSDTEDNYAAQLDRFRKPSDSTGGETEEEEEEEEEEEGRVEGKTDSNSLPQESK